MFTFIAASASTACLTISGIGLPISMHGITLHGIQKIGPSSGSQALRAELNPHHIRGHEFCHREEDQSTLAITRAIMD